MKRKRTLILSALCLLLALLLGGCRFAVVETGEVLIEAATAAPAR